MLWIYGLTELRQNHSRRESCCRRRRSRAGVCRVGASQIYGVSFNGALLADHTHLIDSCEESSKSRVSARTNTAILVDKRIRCISYYPMPSPSHTTSRLTNNVLYLPTAPMAYNDPIPPRLNGSRSLLPIYPSRHPHLRVLGSRTLYENVCYEVAMARMLGTTELLLSNCYASATQTFYALSPSLWD